MVRARALLVVVAIVAAGVAGLGTRVAGASGPWVSTVAGTFYTDFNGDGIAAQTANLDHPQGVAVDADGNVFIADRTHHRIRRVDAITRLISTVAGTGTAGYNGDGITATSAQLSSPSGVWLDADGNLFIADERNNRVRRVDAISHLITTVAGSGTQGYNGDDITATTADLYYPRAVVGDADGNLFIADQRNNRVRKVDAGNGKIYTIAGTGVGAYNEDEIDATTAMLNRPSALAFDPDGNLVIGDFYNSRIRMIDSEGKIHTIAGTGVAGFDGDGGAATSAELNYPIGIVYDSDGNLFIADSSNARIRMVDGGTGNISTVAGTGAQPGFNGDGILGTDAIMFSPEDLAIDSAGNVFIGQAALNVVRRLGSAPPTCLGHNVTILGSELDDVIVGTGLDDVVMSFGGADQIDTGDGDDVVCSGRGADFIITGSGDDLVDAGPGGDTVYGGIGADVIHAGSGKDHVYGEAGNDWIYGEGGKDKLKGSSGNDRLFGGGSDDKLFGQAGPRDRLSGGGGTDTLDGGGGKQDRCDGETEIHCELPL